MPSSLTIDQIIIAVACLTALTVAIGIGRALRNSRTGPERSATVSSETSPSSNNSTASYAAQVSTAGVPAVCSAAPAAVKLPVADFVVDDACSSSRSYAAVAIVSAGEAAGYRVQKKGAQVAAPASASGSCTASCNSSAAMQSYAAIAAQVKPAHPSAAR